MTGKKILLHSSFVPNVTTGLTNLEFAQVLEDAFDTPTPFMQELIRRFGKLAETESGKFQIEGKDVPIQLNCPMCGSTLDLTLE